MYEHDPLFAELSAQGLINALQTRKAEIVVASRTIYGDLLSEPNSKVDFSDVTAFYCDESVPQTLAEKFANKFDKTLQQVPNK